MRWFWIDRFTEFEQGRRAVAVKTVSLSEPHLHEWIPGFPAMPGSLILEGLAQTAGMLVAAHNEFRERVVLAKMSLIQFHGMARPGDTITYTVSLENIQTNGAICRGAGRIGDRPLVDVQLFFAHLDRRKEASPLFEPADFLRMLRTFRIFNVAQDADGNRLEIPAYLLDAERVDLQLEESSP